MDDFAFHRVGDTELRNELSHVGSARGRSRRGMGDRPARENCLLDLLGGGQIRFWRAGTNHGVNADQTEDSTAIRSNDGAFLIPAKDIGRHDEHIGLLSGGKPVSKRRHYSKGIFNFVPGMLFKPRRELQKYFLRRSATHYVKYGHCFATA